MFNKALFAILVITGAAAALAWAQPPDYAVFPGDERPRHDRSADDRLARMAEYLELSDAQATEWQAITKRHIDAMFVQRERIESLGSDFRGLADQQDPDLAELGQMALDLHREMESARSSRGQLLIDLEEILTPEQAERFAALKAAREFAGNRGHRGPRDRRPAPNPD